MSDFSLLGGGSYALEVGYDYSTTTPTQVTSDVLANTLGSYVELISAANNLQSASSCEVILSKFGTSGPDGLILVNIAIGEAGSEVVIFPNLLAAGSVDGGVTNYKYQFPVIIPSGVRISVNLQSELAGILTFGVSLILTYNSLATESGLATIEDIGANTSTTRGIVVATSGTVNTFGSFVEMTPSTDNYYKGFVVGHFKATGSWSRLQLTFDLAVGSAGNEEVIFSGNHGHIVSTESGGGLVTKFIDVGIAAGSRVSIRAQSDKTNADKNFDYVIYGVR